jgi:hypothetical protein
MNMFFHKICKENAWSGLIYFSLRENSSKKSIISKYLHFRYIGVVYVRNNEMSAHYQLTNIDKEFDALVFIDRTNAL